jgi:hypothetical protein
LERGLKNYYFLEGEIIHMSTGTIITLIGVIVGLYGGTSFLVYKCVTAAEKKDSAEE